MNFVHKNIGNENGFTLIEMVLVALMILILATMALASMRRAREAALETGAQKALKSLAEAQEMFYQDNYQFAGNYGSLLQRYLPRTYTQEDQADGFIRGYSVVFQRQGQPALGSSTISNYSAYPHYTIYAVPIPSRLDLRTFWITQSGRVTRYVAIP